MRLKFPGVAVREPALVKPVRLSVDVAGLAPAVAQPHVAAARLELNALSKAVGRSLPLPAKVDLRLGSRVGLTEADPSTSSISVAARHRQTPGVVLHEAGHLMQNDALMRAKLTGAARKLQMLNGEVMRLTHLTLAATEHQQALEAAHAKLPKAQRAAAQAAFDARWAEAAARQDAAFAKLRAAELKAADSFATLMPYYELFADSVATFVTNDPDLMAKASRNATRSFSRKPEVRRRETDAYALFQPFRHHLWKHYLRRPAYRGRPEVLVTLNRVMLQEIARGRSWRSDDSPATLNLKLMSAFDQAMGRRGLPTAFTVID